MHDPIAPADKLPRRTFLQSSLLAGAGLLLPLPGRAQSAPPERTFLLARRGGLPASLRCRGDAFDTDYLGPGSVLGHVQVRCRAAGSRDPWRQWDTGQAASGARGDADGIVLAATAGQPLRLESHLRERDGALHWDLTLHNTGALPLEVGDLALPLPIHTQSKRGKPASVVLKHSFVSGHGSFAFWMRSNSVGPYLMMTLAPGTHLEYWDRQPATENNAPPTWRVYIHGAAAAAATRAEGCNWRQPVSSLTLASGERRDYGLRLAWADGYDGVRDALAAAGALDVQVVPGMTVPRGRQTLIALRSSAAIHALLAEHAAQTTLEDRGERAGRRLFAVDFTRLGENRLTVQHGDGASTHLEFFVTEPVRTLLDKRAAFIAAHQFRDSSKWYDGLLAEWASDRRKMLGPDDYDRIGGWRIYEVTCDDPGLSKPAFLASKNAERPLQAEVEALDQYIEHFVWGGLQQTTAEPYPYAIYGIIDWKRNRDSPDPGPKGRQHLWRPYDYPHIALMYYGMYRVAREHPQVRTRLSAAQYLERAWGTALAMFTVPAQLVDWQGYRTGFYNECCYPDLIEALQREGQGARAAQLRAHWERKVRTFVSGEVDLFASEYAFDSTGFESTQALARYALDHVAQSRPIADAAATRRFVHTQMRANLFCRGVVEPAYYTLGSDYRGEGGDAYTLSYMAQMGGWAVLDYALHDAADPHPYLRLASASQLSAFALINSGDAQSGYGYWYPGRDNDGASAGGFEPAPAGTTWLEQPHHRGPWYYACESDLGFCGALRAAATILADDPVFGRICYGGDVRTTPAGLEVVPDDGVNRRFHVRLDGAAFGLELAHDRFATDQPIVLQDAAAARVAFRIQSDDPGEHRTRVRICGLPEGRYLIEHAGGRESFQAAGAAVTVEVPVAGASDVRLRRA